MRSTSLSQIAGRQVQLTLPVDSTAGPEIADGGELSQVRDGLRGRPRPGLQHALAEDDPRLQARDPGLRALLRRGRRAGQRGPQVPEPVPLDLTPRLPGARRRPARVREPDRRHLRALGRARRPLPRHLGPGRKPRPDDERDRRPQARAREGDQPPARLHAKREHDLRQPPRRARRRRPARRRLEARRRAPAPVPGRAPGRRPRRRPDRPRPRPDRPPPGRLERPRRPHPHPAGARLRRDRLGLARVRPRSREPRRTSRSPPTTTTPRAASARRSARFRTRTRRSASSAPTPRSWSGGSTTSARAPAHIDAIGDIGDIAATFNPFTLSLPGGLPNILDNPLTGDEILGSLDLGNDQKCPNANERPIDGGGVPFTDGGALTDGNQANGECDPSQVLPGP